MNATDAVCRIPEPSRSKVPTDTGGLDLPVTPAIIEAADPRTFSGHPDAGNPPTRKQEQIVLEADEITLKVGDVMLSMTREDGGTLEIRAPRVRIVGEEIISEAEGANTIAGDSVVSEARLHNDVLGKLIRIDGQCVQINS